jgi:hypothetical protein
VTADFTPKPGQNIFRDVTTDPITGKPHKVKVCGPWLQFDEDEPIQLPEPGMHVRLWCSEGEKKALVRGHDTDSLYHVEGRSIQDFDKVMGDYAAAFGPDGAIHYQRNDLEPGYASEGIHHIEPDGRWVMNNDRRLNAAVEVRDPSGAKRDVVLIQTHMVGAYLVGKCDEATNSGVARYSPKGLEHYPQFTQFPPFTNAQGWVAIQGSEWKMTPEPDAVPWIRHEDLAAAFPSLPGQPPAPVPPVVPPPPAPADCTAERAKITDLERWLSLETSRNADLHVEIAKLHAERLTPDQVIRLVNDATGQMAGYWRYLGVQGAVDRAVKAALAKR